MKTSWDNLEIKNTNLKNYKDTVYGNVKGWCALESVFICDFLDSIEFNKEGGLCEIGVELGRSYILYNSIIDEKYASYAVDLFYSASQDYNYSGYNLENKIDIFTENVKKYDVHRGKQTNIILADSLEYEKYYREIKNIRIFHIDGGHEVSHILNDLEFANKVINASGVIIVDDYMNSDFPSVTQGIFLYLQKYPTVVPFLSAFNKLYLCRLPFYERYLEKTKSFLQYMSETIKNPYLHPNDSYYTASINRYAMYSINEGRILKDTDFYKRNNYVQSLPTNGPS